MQIRRLKFTWTPGQIVQVWQKREGYRSIALGDDVEIDDVPVEDIEVIHGAFAAALDLPCRPRTYEEMLAGHTREGLRLLDPGNIFTLVVNVYNEDFEPRVSVHRDLRDAEDALRQMVPGLALHQEIDGAELITAALERDHHAVIDSHPLP